MTEKTRRMAGHFIRIGISLGLLAWLLYRFDLRGVWGYFEGLRVSLWATAFLMFLLAQILSSIRWWILANTLSFSGPWATYLGFYFVGMFFNLFLPTGIGGDLFKAHFLSRKEGRRFLALFTVVGDRFFGMVAMLLLGGGAVALWSGLLPQPFAGFLLLSGLIILVCLAGFPLLQRAMRRLWPQVSERLEGLFILWRHPKRFFCVVGLSFALQILGMGAVVVLGAGIHIHLPPAFYFAVLPLVGIITLIPVSFNGIGVREGAFVYFLGLKGIEAEPALGLGLLFFSLQVALSLVGGFAYAAGVHRRSIMNG